MSSSDLPPIDSASAPKRIRVFSVGHSNHDLESFLELLSLHRIEVLADVRSQPWSRYSRHFNRTQLEGALKSADFQYVFLGKELGGRPEGDEFYDSEGHVRYDRTAASNFFRSGVERLVHGAARYRVAMMCSEGEPVDCHRHLLIARVLAERGVAVVHILPDGSVLEDSSLSHDRPIQETLFASGESAWRSVRSVSPNTVPVHSSGSSGMPASTD